MTARSGAARFARAAPLLWVAACIDYNPAGKPDEPVVVGHDTSAPDTDTADDTAETAPPPEEVCDGVDNDGDAEIDEGFEDIDSDSVADCVDGACVVYLDGDEGVSDPHLCERSVAPPVDPWNVEVLWEHAEDTSCLSVVAGDLWADGTSELVCVESIEGSLRVIDGPTGTTAWRLAILEDWTGIAIANLDADPQLEILAYSPTGSILAVEPDGVVLWESFDVVPTVRANLIPLEVADLDADGLPEVIGPDAILSGSDGRTLVRIADSVQGDPRHEEVAVADIEDDGSVDILTEWTRFAGDGSTLWQHAFVDESSTAVLTLLVQADGDADAEVLFYSDEFFVLLEPDGTVIYEYDAPLLTPSIPCAGDIDGDGRMDLVGMGTDRSYAWDISARTMWNGPYSDSTDYSVGCTTFDFDLDGAKEVVYGDESALFILDGTTGSVLFQHDRYSATFDDRILVVDLDGDGSVEIVSSTWGGGAAPMLRAYGNVNRDWPPGTQMWPSATWSGTSLLPDGRVPRTPQKPWLTTKVWRGQPELPVFGSDLRPAIGDMCVASCADDGEVRVEVRLQNLGPDEVEAGVPLAVYGLDGTGGRVLLTVFTLADWLDDGRAAASWEVVTTTAQAERGLVFVAGDDGTGSVHPDDCATENSTVEWALTACP